MSKKDSKCCPKCNTIINKNGGCDHMNCTLCKHKFNWSECINKQETDMELALHKLTAIALKYTRPFNWWSMLSILTGSSNVSYVEIDVIFIFVSMLQNKLVQ
jgi:hypothetical protein